MATVGKSFSDPDKWEQGWYLSLPVKLKLLFNYLWDRCDHAGIIEIVPSLWGAHLGEPVTKEDLNKLIELVNQDQERIFLKGRKLWFTEYIRFNQQQDPEKSLSDTYSFHRHVWKRIITHDLIDDINQRDPILLLNFDTKVDDSDIHPKPSLSLVEGLDKPTGKSSGKGNGGSDGRDSIDPDRKETALEFEMRSNGSLDDTPF